MAEAFMAPGNCPPAPSKPPTSRRDLDDKMGRVGALVSELEQCPIESVRASVGEVIDTLMSIHQEAMTGILDRLNGDRGLIKELGDDPVIGSVLLLHGLHPDDVPTRLQTALEKVRPLLQTHRGDVELLETDGHRVRLKLKGTCNGCPSSTTTFKNLIEEAIYSFAPEIESIEIDGLVPLEGAR